MMEKIQVHRPGALKQTNKPHKHGRHRSKGSISVSSKGKVSVKALSKRHKRELTKEQRRHQATQIRQNKRDEVLSKKRSIGGSHSAPFLVCILPLHKSIDANSVLNFFAQCDEEAGVNKSPTGVTHISIPRFKQKFAFVVPNLDDDFAMLDTLKTCDAVLFVISASIALHFADEIVDQWGTNQLLSSFAQGLPTPFVIVTELESIAQKQRGEHKKTIQKMVSTWLPKQKIITLDKQADAINILRKIGQHKLNKIIYRDRRPYIYADQIEYVSDTASIGTLKITGYLRGSRLSVNNLIHLPGLGDFQMLQIDSPVDPYGFEKKRSNEDDEMQAATTIIRVLERADPSKQESLESENIPDLMDAEQIWPTEEELKQAEEGRKVKRVPKGWSDYQAAWIPDEDISVSDGEDEEEDVASDYMDAMSEEKSNCSDAEDDFEDVTESELDVTDQQYDKQLDLSVEKDDLDKIKAAKVDRMFPDEIDTPQDVTARVRFQKYRGLESFRTSPWDPKENLPSDYAKIFQFENFDRTKRRILKAQDDNDGVLPGWYITIHIKDVSQHLWTAFESAKLPVVAVGLLPFEHKMTTVNVVLKRTTNYNQPIQSKERLVIQCGYRRYIINSLFSQHTNGQKHKYERFFQPNTTAVATFYAPIQFPPAPVLCFKEIGGKLVMVAHGSLLSCNPDRLIIKRVVLSGHPFKVHKRTAVVRFMFFNREDIVYFKSVKLGTKYGRTGHIKEPLGTHGHMKCIFDGQLKSMDTILLNLYKRIFPKWNYEDCNVLCNTKPSTTMET